MVAELLLCGLVLFALRITFSLELDQLSFQIFQVSGEFIALFLCLLELCCLVAELLLCGLVLFALRFTFSLELGLELSHGRFHGRDCLSLTLAHLLALMEPVGARQPLFF